MDVEMHVEIGVGLDAEIEMDNVDNAGWSSSI